VKWTAIGLGSNLIPAVTHERAPECHRTGATRTSALAPFLALLCTCLFSADLPGAHAFQRDGDQAAKRSQPDTIVTVVVPATAPWTDTGVRLSAGDRVAIRTWGRVTFDGAAAATTSPTGSGRRGGGCSFVVTDAGVAAQAVVGNVAPAVNLDGRGFYVGAVWKGTAPIPGSTAPEGRLLLGFNDEGVLCDRSGYDSWDFGVNNAGAFTAEIAITRARTGRLR
jgi:hypothetical protein